MLFALSVRVILQLICYSPCSFTSHALPQCTRSRLHTHIHVHSQLQVEHGKFDTQTHNNAWLGYAWLWCCVCYVYFVAHAMHHNKQTSPLCSLSSSAAPLLV